MASSSVSIDYHPNHETLPLACKFPQFTLDPSRSSQIDLIPPLPFPSRPKPVRQLQEKALNLTFDLVPSIDDPKGGSFFC